MIVGLLHPGEMGSALGEALRDNGHDVIWASEGRSDATRARAAPFRDVQSVPALADEAQHVPAADARTRHRPSGGSKIPPSEAGTNNFPGGIAGAKVRIGLGEIGMRVGLPCRLDEAAGAA